MSFIKKEENTGKAYAPGLFLAHAECTRKTYQFKADDTNVVTADNGGKYIPMGTVMTASDGSVEGITYEDVDVTYGDMPGSLVTSGTVYKSLLNGTVEDSALTTAGFKVIADVPTVERPADFDLPTEEESTSTDSTSSTEVTE